MLKKSRVVVNRTWKTREATWDFIKQILDEA